MSVERPTSLFEAASKIEDLFRDVERLTAERDRAREECGHEKAMRASQREEMMRYFVDWQAAKAKVERVEALHVPGEKFGLCVECQQGMPCDTLCALASPEPDTTEEAP